MVLFPLGVEHTVYVRTPEGIWHEFNSMYEAEEYVSAYGEHRGFRKIERVMGWGESILWIWS